MNGDMTVVDDAASMFDAGMAQMAPSASVAVQLAGAMVDKRIATARMYPRSISRFKTEAAALLSEDYETAASAEYAKPVGNTTVRGPSVRLAELAALCWGNLDVEVGDPIVGDKAVTVMASAWDLQRNYRAPGISSVSIIKRDGSRMPGHVIENLVLATAAKARRNAILTIIPRSYINHLLDAALAIVRKTKQPLEVIRQKALEQFARNYKVQADQICTFLEIAGVDDITEEHLDTLRAVNTSLKEGSAIEEFFSSKAANKGDEIKAKIAEKRAGQKLSGASVPSEPTKPPEAKPIAETKPVASPATTGPTKIDLANLLDELDADGGDSSVFLKKQGITVEQLCSARGKMFDAYLRALRLAIAQNTQSKMGAADANIDAIQN